MADFQLPVEVLVNVAATGGEAGVICGKKDEEITLDELRRLHAAVEDEIAKESGELEEFLCQKVRPLKSSNEVKDAIEISGKIGVLAEDLDLAAEHCRDRIEALRNIRDDHHGIIAEVEDYMVMCAVLEKFRNLSNCVDSLSRKISLLNCVETLEGAKKLHAKIRSLPGWARCSRLYGDMDNSALQCVLISRGMIEYLLSRLIVLEQNGENTVIFTVNLEHTGIEDPSSPAISFGVLGEVVGLKGEEDYFAQIAQQIHDIVIGPVLEKPAAFRSSIEKSDKKLVCTMKASDKDKSYISTFETIISVIEVVKEGVSLACSDAAAMHILRFWGDNHIDKLKRTLLKSVDAATPDRLEFAPAFQNDLSELGRLTEKIENILPGYSFFDTKLLHTHAKDLIVSKICNRTLNDILMCYVNAKGRDVVPCKLEGHNPFNIHSYAVSIADYILNALSESRIWPEKSSALMYKTIEESFNFIARDSSALFYFTEPRSLRNILLYNNDFIYICTFLEDSVNADGCIHFKTILSQFRDEIRKSVEEMISIEIDLEAQKIIGSVRSWGMLHVTAFRNFKAEALLRDIIPLLKSAAEDPSIAYPHTIYATIMGKLLDSCFSEVITILLKMESISKIESKCISDFIISLISRCSEILASGNSACSMDKCVPSYKMLVCILDIMRLDLSEICVELKKGSMDLFRGDCIGSLIISIFEDSPLRRKVLELVDKRLLRHPDGRTAM